MSREILNPEGERISRRALFGRGAKHGGEIALGAVGATAVLRRDEIEAEIRALDGSVYDEYYKYIEGYVNLGIESYYRDKYLGRVNKEQLSSQTETISPGKVLGRFILRDRQFVCLRLMGQLDEDYSVGLFKARLDPSSNGEEEQIEHYIPAIQTPDTDEQTIYLGFLDQGEHEIEVESVPNDVYETSTISNIELFTISGNQNVTYILERLTDIGMREDIVQSGRLIKNIPLSTDLRIRRSVDEDQSSSPLFEIWMDLSGEYGGKPPVERIAGNDRRLYDREWVTMTKVDKSGQVEEDVFQGRHHSVKPVDPNEVFSLNVDQDNNMFSQPRKTRKVVNLLPTSLLPGSYQRFIELRNPLLLISAQEEIHNGRIGPQNEALLRSLSNVDGARNILRAFAERHGMVF